MAKYTTPYKAVLEGIQDAVDMGYLSEDRSTWWLQCSWHINEEDIICFFEDLKVLKLNVFRRMAAVPVVVEYTDGEEENNVEELGFDGGYKISAENLSPIYIGWYSGSAAGAKELEPVTRLAIKGSARPFTESKKRNLKKSQIEEEYTRTIESALEDANIYTQELYVYEDEVGILHAQFDLSGDWKHQHMLAKNIMKELGWQKDVENVEDSGEDYYFAHYEFTNIASAQKYVSARSSEGHLVAESKSKKEARVARNTIWSPVRVKKEILECIEDWGDNLGEYKPPIVSGDKEEASAAFVFHGVKVKAKFDFKKDYYEMEDENEEFDAFEGKLEEFGGDLDELLADIGMKDGPKEDE